ncbi:MAG TPA: ABC transporter permease [Actinomycetaceae bacterium]|nr:ABC transporter permease [Actinomycetaceae bacterium]
MGGGKTAFARADAGHLCTPERPEVNVATSFPDLRALSRRAVPAPRPTGEAPSEPSSRRVLLPLAAGIALLVVWELACRTGRIDPFFLPAPSAIMARLVNDLLTTPLPRFLATTVLEAVGGAALAIVVALPLGYFVAKSRTAARIIEPYAAASQAIPAIAIAPLLVLWIGRGFMPIVVLCALMVFFPMMLGTTLGLRLIPQDYTDAARLDGAGSRQLLRHIEFPLALPSLLTGMRNGLTLAFTGAIVGEFTMGGRGLGMALDMHRRNGDTTALFATLVLLATFAMGTYGLMRLIERRVEAQL